MHPIQPNTPAMFSRWPPSASTASIEPKSYRVAKGPFQLRRRPLSRIARRPMNGKNWRAAARRTLPVKGSYCWFAAQHQTVCKRPRPRRSRAPNTAPGRSRHSRCKKLPGQKHPERSQRRTQDALYDRGTGGRQVADMPRVTVRSKRSRPALQCKGPNSMNCLPRDLCRQEFGEQIIVIGL
jgi:hypothetical protein